MLIRLKVSDSFSLVWVIGGVVDLGVCFVLVDVFVVMCGVLVEVGILLLLFE